VGQLIATLRKDVLPKSPLGQALKYAENQWPAMARYLEVPQAELDNNSIEHSLPNDQPMTSAPYANATRVVGASGSQPRGGLLLIDPTSLIEIWRPRVLGPFTSTSLGLQVC
jgi:hypothetical protein